MKQKNVMSDILIFCLFFFQEEKFPHVKRNERNVESEYGNNPEDLKF